MGVEARVLLLVLKRLCEANNGVLGHLDIAYYIVSLVDFSLIENNGRSTFAKKRRAKKLGRCFRCYRVNPGFYYTKKCDGVSCVSPMGYNYEVMCIIKHGKCKARELLEARGCDVQGLYPQMY
ncbi:nucleic acid binding protein [Rose virus B]|uniref:RNA silencing suppressor n=1 Tax=Rose virus B TaxID=2777710 RepID=A0A7L9QHX1_9VIRU|nr:nucleic acid binding protein [Rose virus B]QOL02535.1 nucleic acid binding protein [Rose virus B]